ncbi:MAG: DNA repair protein RadA [Acidimicrobiales bacterium]|jgi:DNA repair protein RadA/Sms
MKPTRSLHRCSNCGATATRWAGKCPSCGEWNTLVVDPAKKAAPEARAVALRDVDPHGCRPFPTGVTELDRVLSGGLSAGSVTLLFGEPGVGKSTLVTQILLHVATCGPVALLASAEELSSQVRKRTERLGVVPDSLLVAAVSTVEEIEEAVSRSVPTLTVVDSVQAIFDPDASGSRGSLTQVRACTERLARLAHDSGSAVFVVGHVTKDGDIAGPRTLEHMVDTVVSLEGDRHHSLRFLRALKHRFGPTGDVGILEMRESGLSSVDDPGALLLEDRKVDVPGSTVVPVLDGRRPLLVEIQALTSAAPGYAASSNPSRAGGRRSAQGIDARRLECLLAVLDRRAGVHLGDSDVFVSVTGGVRLSEPAADLALALALYSSAADVAVPEGIAAFGEVGLAGEVRQVPGSARRLAECARLGFTSAVVPESTPKDTYGIDLLRVSTLKEAVELVGAVSLVERRTPEFATTICSW